MIEHDPEFVGLSNINLDEILQYAEEQGICVDKSNYIPPNYDFETIVNKSFTTTDNSETHEIMQLIGDLAKPSEQLIYNLQNTFETNCNNKSSTKQILELLLATIVDESDAVCRKCNTHNKTTGLNKHFLNKLRKTKINTVSSDDIIITVLQRIDTLMYTNCKCCNYMYNM